MPGIQKIRVADELAVHYRGGIGKSEMIRGVGHFFNLLVFLSDCIVNDICDRAALLPGTGHFFHFHGLSPRLVRKQKGW
jgi:hypothetical protein